MKRSLDSALERPAKRHKSNAHRYHISDGPLRIIISCLAQSEYAKWLCTHKNAKRFKFNGHTVYLNNLNITNPRSYEDWWFHRRSVTYEDISEQTKPRLDGWDCLELKTVSVNSFPPCRELRLTGQVLTHTWISLHSDTRRLVVNTAAWTKITWENCKNIESLEIIGVDDPDRLLYYISMFYLRPVKLRHLVFRCLSAKDLPRLLIAPLAELELFEVHVPVGSRVSAGEPNVRIINFEPKE